MKRNIIRHFRIVAFILTIIILVLNFIRILSSDREYSPVENRNLEMRPSFTWESARSGRYEEQYEAYIEDQFPFRTAWIWMKTTVDRLIGKKECNGIYLGDDGYLIQNFIDPDEEKLNESLSALSSFSKKHADIQKYALIAPTAVSVLSDKLPKHAIVGDENAFLDRISHEFSNMGIRFIDVRSDLFVAAQSGQVYYRTDHHWTTDGAYTAYLKFADFAELGGKHTKYNRELVSDSFSGTLTASSGFRMQETDELYVYLPKSESVDYTVNYVEEQKNTPSFYCTDYLDKREQYSIFFGGNHSLVEIQTTARTGRNLLVFKDSYANCFVPFLVEDYDEIILVDPRYYADDLELLMETKQITDILFLYNANTLAGDADLKTVLATD